MPTAVDQTTGVNTGPLYSGEEIVQTFEVDADLLSGLRLMVGTYGRRPETHVRLEVREASGRCLRESVVDARWFDDNSWQLFAFPPLEARGQTLTIAFRSEGTTEEQAIALWLNAEIRPSALRNGVSTGGALCFTQRASLANEELVDSILFEPGHAPPITRRDALRRCFRQCLLSEELSFQRLLHLADGIRRARKEVGDLRRVLSIGAGAGCHEAYLAARLPGVEVIASDWKIGLEPDDLPNFRWEIHDLVSWEDGGDYDLVFSIECLEHIADPVRAFTNMTRKVRPGGCLYLSVPFATADEQADPRLCREEWERYEHYRPGFSSADLDGLFRDHGFRVLHSSNMFYRALGRFVHELLDGLDSAARESVLGNAAALLLHDLDGPPAENRNHATGIWMLGRRLD